MAGFWRQICLASGPRLSFIPGTYANPLAASHVAGDAVLFLPA